jgi:hypothetical protein
MPCMIWSERTGTWVPGMDDLDLSFLVLRGILYIFCLPCCTNQQFQMIGPFKVSKKIVKENCKITYSTLFTIYSVD